MALSALLATLVPSLAAPAAPPPPNVSAAGVIVVEATTGKVLLERAADVPRFPASTTKVLTALLLLELTRPEEIIVAPEGVEKVEGSSLHLVPGERVTSHDLLHAILLRSANDACVAIAHHISGSVSAFADLMNERARQLGCRNTRFTNPNGLPDTAHTTTPRDLAIMARAAMRDPEFQSVVSARRATIERSVNPQDRLIVNRNRYLDVDSSADGIKTGYTVAAGKCYVGSATRNGFRVITVLLKSQDWVADHKALLDWSYKHFRRASRVSPGAPLRALAVTSGEHASVPVVARDEVIALERPSSPAKPHVDWLLPESVPAPVRAGQMVGGLRIRDGDGHVSETPLLAASAVDEAPMRLVVGGLGSAGYWIGGGMLAAAFLLRRRARWL